MNIRKNKTGLYGIQKKMMLYTMTLIVLTVFLIMVIVNVIIWRNIRRNLSQQYSYVNDKFYSSFQSLYENLESITDNCITNGNIQNSLKNKELSVYEREILSKTLQYMDEEIIESFLYLDNKDNIYTRNQHSIRVDELKKSVPYQGMGTDYSKVKLFWAESILSEHQGYALYAGRYVRQLERQYQPGIIFLKLKKAVFEQMAAEIPTDTTACFWIDRMGKVCFERFPTIWERSQKEEETVKEEITSTYQKMKEINDSRMYSKNGLIYIKQHPESGFAVVLFVPNQTLYQVFWQIQGTFLVVLVVVFVLAFLLSRLLVRKLTSPIRYISGLMENFDDTKLTVIAELHTNTELDGIGDAYNKMLIRITKLINQVTLKERELRKAELDTMLYQIRPHFLYNTLDTIYMLARISKEETIMQMVQSLSNYLRINLSNGAEEITIADELAHVKSYLDIQNIRSDGMFIYQITVAEQLKTIPVLKMILQPVVENCLKHAFDERELGIAIDVNEHDSDIVFQIENDGRQMPEQDRVRLNHLEKMEMKAMVPPMSPGKKGGFGIYNVVKRLRLRYHDQIRFYYTASEHKTMCVIKIKKEWMNLHG